MSTIMYTNSAAVSPTLIAWFIVSIVAAVGMLFAKKHIADWLLKLYHYFIQQNHF